MPRTFATPALLVALALISACNKKDHATAAQAQQANRASQVAGTKQSVVEALGGASNLGTMAGLVKSAGLDQAFNGVGNYTLFAPTDDAFRRLPEGQLKQLQSKEGRPQLIAMLRQHVVTGYIPQGDLDKGLARNGGAASMATMGGAPVRVHRVDRAIILGSGDGGPKIAAAPIVSRNGVIYPIDQVIPPTTVAQAGPAKR